MPGMKCPKCGGQFTYTRIKTGQLVCRSCGNITELKTEEKK
jgi:ribosomal protein L37AE/L43A